MPTEKEAAATAVPSSSACGILYGVAADTACRSHDQDRVSRRRSKSVDQLPERGMFRAMLARSADNQDEQDICCACGPFPVTNAWS